MKKVLSYLLPSLLCALVAVLILVSRESFNASGITLILDLCDAFAVPGIVMLCFGLLVWATNGGVFNMLAFGVIKLIDLFKKDLTKVKYRTYYDYQKSKSENKRPVLSYLIVGTIFTLIAVIFLILYATKYGGLSDLS